LRQDGRDLRVLVARRWDVSCSNSVAAHPMCVDTSLANGAWTVLLVRVGRFPYSKHRLETALAENVSAGKNVCLVKVAVLVLTWRS
jgi:hypothetical protein